MLDFFLAILLSFQIGTGIGLSSLQDKVDKLEYKAIQNKPFTSEEKGWLRVFYRTFAYGGQLIIILPEASRLLHHYLDGTGKQTTIDKDVLFSSKRFKNQFYKLKKKVRKKCILDNKFISPRFDMGHGGFNDQAIALYYGTISGRIIQKNKNNISIQWTVDMPWKWPNYDEIGKKKGRDKKETYPLPNFLSFLGLGPHLWLDNELAGELQDLGMAKSFDVVTKWITKSKCL